MSSRLTVVVPGSAPGIQEAVRHLETLWADQSLPPAGCWPFQVALDEVLSNIVRHGYEGAEKAIELAFCLEGDTLEVAVSDEAPPFDPLGVAALDVDQPLESRPTGGLGIAIVRKIMDAVEYEHRDGRNHLRMRRKVAP